MDSLITAAARALAAGDLLGVLKRVGLRGDAPALALRGIAMAQLGDFVRAKALLQNAACAFGPREAVARARCVVAEAEIALVSRDLGWPPKALDAARATLEKYGDWLNAAHARHLEVRRLLLIGRLDEAERALAGLDPVPFPPASRAAHELVVAAIAMRRVRAKVAGIPALMVEVESASLVLNTPAARLIARGEERLLLLEEVEVVLEFGLSSWTRAVMSCAAKTRWSRSQGVRCCSRSRVRSAKRGPETCQGMRSSSEHSVQNTPTGGASTMTSRARRGASANPCVVALTLPSDQSSARSRPISTRKRARCDSSSARNAITSACWSSGELWPSSALALALGASARTAQRALDSLAIAGKVQSYGRGRARRW